MEGRNFILLPSCELPPGGLVIGIALRDAAAALATISDTPRLDAELLMAHALGMTREALLLSHQRDVVPDTFTMLLARRLQHEPVAYITGTRAFWTIDLAVGPGVLIPRPDSETLIEAAVAHFGRSGPHRILDLGTGPGTLLLAALAEWPGATGIGVELSPAALAFAHANAERLGLTERARLVAGDWAAGITERFDLVLCNPPYVAADAALARQVRAWEPAEALFAGLDGLGAYRLLAPQLPPLLAADGIACIEIGAGQARAVTQLLAKAGLTVSSRRDLGGHERCLVAAVPD